MIYTYTPQESAAMSRDKLLKAMKALAEAQQAVVQAIETLDMFENNFRRGFYKRGDEPPYMDNKFYATLGTQRGQANQQA